MKFIPNAKHKQRMLQEIDLHDINELFVDIPNKIRIQKIPIPKGLTQQQTEETLNEIGKKNKSWNECPSFLGGGIKPHYIPALVKAIIAQPEIYTAYTPYQPEASQGFLQAMFEYQSLIAVLTGMDIANASLYDGATAIGEAILMSSRINKKKVFLVPQNISWEKRSIIKNYTKGAGITISEMPYNTKSGKIDIHQLKQQLNQDVSGVYVENPNFFGIFEDDVTELNTLIHQKNALFVVGVDPISLGITKSPGDYGADIVVGEGRALGNPMDFGGSGLGIFACKDQFIRHIPGRLIGLTHDSKGNQAYCMTMQTREQHIRRGRATSNICTNEGLNAIAAVVYLAWLGGKGLEQIGKINFEKANNVADTITSIPGFEKVFTGTHFNEFLIKCKNPHKVNNKLLKNNLQGGLLLDIHYHDLINCMLFGITELHTEQQTKTLITLLKGVK